MILHFEVTAYVSNSDENVSETGFVEGATVADATRRVVDMVGEENFESITITAIQGSTEGIIFSEDIPECEE